MGTGHRRLVGEPLPCLPTREGLPPAPAWLPTPRVPLLSVSAD